MCTNTLLIFCLDEGTTAHALGVAARLRESFAGVVFVIIKVICADDLQFRTDNHGFIQIRLKTGGLLEKVLWFIPLANMKQIPVPHSLGKLGESII